MKKIPCWDIADLKNPIILYSRVTKNDKILEIIVVFLRRKIRFDSGCKLFKKHDFFWMFKNGRGRITPPSRDIISC